VFFQLAVASADHSSYDCFACAILTHGGDKDALFASDQTFHLKELTRAITADKCPSLAGKPKLFFVQVSQCGVFNQPFQYYRE